MDRDEARASDFRPRAPLRVCVIGAGAIARRLVELASERLAGSIVFSAFAMRESTVPRPWWPDGIRQITDPAGLAELRPDVVVEAASRDAVAQWGSAALRSARKLIVCSASAFTDDAVLQTMQATARAEGSQMVLAHGALGGLHALSAAALLPLDQVTHTICKPASAWKGTPAEAMLDLAGLASAASFFEGSAREAARSYPANANSVVVSSLAGVGLDRTLVRLIADPRARLNRHTVEARGRFGHFNLEIENQPMASNPKTSDMTALSLLKLLEAETGAMVV